MSVLQQHNTAAHRSGLPCVIIPNEGGITEEAFRPMTPERPPLRRNPPPLIRLPLPERLQKPQSPPPGPRRPLPSSGQGLRRVERQEPPALSPPLRRVARLQSPSRLRHGALPYSCRNCPPPQPPGPERDPPRSRPDPRG